ncbi:MAG TPA: hypothetical protein VGL42_03150 [Opitutaceae bacterium]|jgi:hypothetical protein
MLDSPKVFEVLKVHLPESQARTVTHAIQQADADLRHDLKSELAAVFATKADLADLRGELRAEMAGAKSEMIRWMFIFWVGQAAAMVAILKLLK